MEHTIVFAIMLVINWSFANGTKIPLEILLEIIEILLACAS